MIARFSKNKLWVRILIISCLAIIVRGLYWVVVPDIGAGDSSLFFHVAHGILSGEMAVLAEFPFHIVYSLFLIPGYILPGGFSWYIPLLNIVLSAIAVIFLYLVSLEITEDESVHFITMLLVIFHPYLLHWMKYVLTEAVFIPALLVLVHLTIKILKQPESKSGLLWVLCVSLLFFTRPVSFLVLVVLGTFSLVAWSRFKFPRQWILTTGVNILVGLIVGAFVIFNPGINQRLMKLPTIIQSLWLSTRVVSGTFEEYKKDTLPPEISVLSVDEQWEYKKEYALDFIQSQPLQYLSMAVKRFFNFYYPWMQPQWSIRHRIFDAILSLGMTISVIASFRGSAEKKLILLLLGCALALGITTAFSQIDTDGRYRLPAEILLIPVAVTGFVYIINAMLSFWKKVVTGYKY